MSNALSYQDLHTIAIESQWGAGWQLQMVAALALAAVSSSMSLWPSGGWLLQAAVAVALCYLLPLLGHAAGAPARMFLHGSHILAAGIWVGTPERDDHRLARAPIRRRSVRPLQPVRSRRGAARCYVTSRRVAFTGSTLLLLTGATAAWWYLGGLLNLVTTTYGRLLLLKLFLVADAAACGFVNWQAAARPNHLDRIAARSPAARRPRNRAQPPRWSS